MKIESTIVVLLYLLFMLLIGSIFVASYAIRIKDHGMRGLAYDVVILHGFEQ